MEGLENPTYLIGWIISNVVGVIILWMAFKKPKIARSMLALLFAWACWMNYTTSHKNPEAYLEYASMSVPWYSEFIRGWFGDHITAVVSTIAVGQGLITVGMLLKGWWLKLACIGTIAFLLAIAPLGVGAGFPFSITVSIAAWVILKKDDLDFLWHLRRAKAIPQKQH